MTIDAPNSGEAKPPEGPEDSKLLSSPGLVVADTGPQICAGCAPGKEGINLLYRRFKAKGIEIVQPQVVHDELRNRGRQTDGVGVGARKMAGRSSFVKIDGTVWDQADRDDIREKIEEAANKRAKRLGHEPKVGRGRNDGEIDAILLARLHGAILLCNERAASLVAREMGLTVAHYGHLLRAEMADGNLLPTDVDNYLNQLPYDVDTGFPNPTALRLSNLEIIRGI